MLAITLPDWLSVHLAPLLAADAPAFVDPEARMRLTIELSRLNVLHASGGPFAATIFERQSGRLIAAGVNRVVASNLSLAHAEMVALAGAQQRLGNFDLGAPGLPECELVSSSEPCAMCFGAIPWSGVRSLLCGAAAADVQAIGFDEGPRHPDWIGELERRGIAVQSGLCREEAVAVLRTYAAMQAPIYNARQGGDACE